MHPQWKKPSESAWYNKKMFRVSCYLVCQLAFIFHFGSFWCSLILCSFGFVQDLTSLRSRLCIISSKNCTLSSLSLFQKWVAGLRWLNVSLARTNIAVALRELYRYIWHKLNDSPLEIYWRTRTFTYKGEWKWTGVMDTDKTGHRWEHWSRAVEMSWEERTIMTDATISL